MIEDAEDIVDSLLGAWPPDADASTGRKVIQTEVEPWQWNKLTRATTKVAARLYGDSGILDNAQWSSVSGPDFSLSGPLGGQAVRVIGTQAAVLLDDSLLRRLKGRARPGSPRGRYASFFNATRHDGT